MVALEGKINAENLNQCIQMKLEEFNLSYKDDIVCSITDGASGLVKMGRISPCEHQQCFAHGIHLAVCDVLYKTKPSMDTHCEVSDGCSRSVSLLVDDKAQSLDIEESANGNIEIDMDDTSTLPDLRDDYQINDTIQRVRKIVKFFRKFPQKNEILQIHVRCEFNKELILFLDTRTRWNSLVNMIERFLKLKKCIEKAMIDIGEVYCMTRDEYSLLEHIAQELQPMKLAIEALGRQDANLLTANGIFKFNHSQLDGIYSNFSIELKRSFTKRLEERSQNNLFSVLKYLHDPELSEKEIQFVSTKSSIYRSVKTFLSRLYPSLEYNIVEDLNLQEIELDSSFTNENNTLSEKLEAAIRMSTVANKIDQNNFTAIQKEMKVFEATKKRTENLELLYQALCSIRPTSIESERAFSAAGLFITKLRSKLCNDSINCICFLLSFFKAHKSNS